MTRCLLDTNILSDLIRNPQWRAARRIAKVGENSIAMTGKFLPFKYCGAKGSEQGLGYKKE